MFFVLSQGIADSEGIIKKLKNRLSNILSIISIIGNTADYSQFL